MHTGILFGVFAYFEIINFLFEILFIRLVTCNFARIIILLVAFTTLFLQSLN